MSLATRNAKLPPSEKPATPLGTVDHPLDLPYRIDDFGRARRVEHLFVQVRGVPVIAQVQANHTEAVGMNRALAAGEHVAGISVTKPAVNEDDAGRRVRLQGYPGFQLHAVAGGQDPAFAAARAGVPLAAAPSGRDHGCRESSARGANALPAPD